MFRVDGVIDTLQILHDLIDGDDITELRLHIEEVPLDDARYAVADRALGNDRLEAVTRGVHDRVADTGAGRGPHDDERIDAEVVQRLREMRAEEIRRIFLVDDRLLRTGFQLRVDLHPVAVDIQRAHGDLLIPTRQIPLLFADIARRRVKNGNAGRHEPFIYIFQLEEMERRLATQPFISNSLSLLGGHYVCISPTQYACALRVLADELMRYPNLQIALVSERDHVPLPALNCWCQRSTWLIQMDADGFRISDEPGIVQAASTTLERCLRLIPPVRKEKASVRNYLLTLADELESLDTAPRAMTGM